MKFSLIYGIIVIFRFIIHLNTQPGYIHPDEFFQTIEISAGEVLKYEILKPWEFDSAFPIRSKAIIELFLNIPLKLYLQLRENLSHLVNIPFDLLTFCRLWTTFCSLIIDYNIYVQSKYFRINYKLALFLHSTSHVSMVFLSRTFSNVWETQLLSLFVIVTINGRGETSEEILQGIIVAFGIFCRPTFSIFVLPYVLKRIIDLCCCCDMKRVCRYGFNGLIGFISVAVALISCDTIKYGSSDPVVTPLNFIGYNSNATNLEEHGRHPLFLHALINVPLMVGPPLMILLVIGVVRRARYTQLLLIAALLVPLVLLSLFPHQEMRFLLPIFPAAVLLATANIKGKSITKLILILHVLFNLVSIVFWGYLHQGAVLGAAGIVRRQIMTTTNHHSNSSTACHLLVAYKSFLLPKFLFEQQQRDSPASSRLPFGCNRSILSVHNLVGLSNESQFWQRLIQIKQQQQHENSSPTVLHLIYPKAFEFKEKENFAKLGELKSIYSIPGHINTDLWPPASSIYDFLCLQYMMFSF